MRSAVRPLSAADLPSARGRGACTCRPTSAFSANASRQGRAASQVGMRPAGPGSSCTPPQHAGEVRVVEHDHLRAVATAWSRPRRSPASGPRSCPGLYCLALSNSCSSSATSASAIRLYRLSDKSVKLMYHVSVLPAITRQPGFRWFVVRDSCVRGSSSAPAPRR